MRKPKGDEYINITDNYPKFEQDRELWKMGQRRLSLNMGLALADGRELKIIKVKQRFYPLHLMGPCFNWFLLFFRNGELATHAGNYNGSARPDAIGVKYRLLDWWSPIPVDEAEVPVNANKEGPKYDAYKVLDGLINNKPFDLFYGQADLDVARQIIGTKKVLC